MAREQRRLELGPQQSRAVDKVTEWYYEEQGRVFRLFGYAGTGKTTLARIIVEELRARRVLFAAYTGKAAYVMRSKGCAGAGTIHSLIYVPVEKLRAHLKALEAELDVETDPGQRDRLQRAIAQEKRKLATPEFILKEDSELGHADLLVLDEVSMVGRRIAEDLLSFGTKLLVLGDPAQLPPIEGGGHFTAAPPHHLLTEIHRSALDSPVTRLATIVRNADPRQNDYGLSGCDRESGRWSSMSDRELLHFDQVLAGTNRIRWRLIHLLRELRGLRGPIPVPGDSIIALANSPAADVFNGQQFTVNDCRTVPDHEERLLLEVTDDEDCRRELTVWKHGFSGWEGERKAREDGRRAVAAATFAQAITVHKAQGSQWERVLVVDESSVFANAEKRRALRSGMADPGGAGHLMGRRWLYTAITRASQQVVVVPTSALSIRRRPGGEGREDRKAA